MRYTSRERPFRTTCINQQRPPYKTQHAFYGLSYWRLTTSHAERSVIVKNKTLECGQREKRRVGINGAWQHRIFTPTLTHPPIYTDTHTHPISRYGKKRAMDRYMNTECSWKGAGPACWSLAELSPKVPKY